MISISALGGVHFRRYLLNHKLFGHETNRHSRGQDF